MSYYRRLIEESEKKRILGMHNTYNKSRLLTIREAYSGTAGEKFDSVESCKKQLPYNVATTLGINWKQAKTSWGSDGSQQQNLVLRDAMCDGWRIGDAKEGTQQGSTSDNTKVDNRAQATDQQVQDIKNEWQKWTCITSKGTQKTRGSEMYYIIGNTEFFIDYNYNTNISNGVVAMTTDGKEIKITDCNNPLIVNSVTGEQPKDGGTQTQTGETQKQKFIEPTF